jgi:hypothetical protein
MKLLPMSIFEIFIARKTSMIGFLRMFFYSKFNIIVKTHKEAPLCIIICDEVLYLKVPIYGAFVDVFA